MRFLGEFERRLIFQGFEGIFGGIVVIFDDVKSGEMLDFSGFCRSGYRTQNGEKRVDGRDMPGLQSNTCSKNVNLAPIYTLAR